MYEDPPSSQPKKTVSEKNSLIHKQNWNLFDVLESIIFQYFNKQSFSCKKINPSKINFAVLKSKILVIENVLI